MFVSAGAPTGSLFIDRIWLLEGSRAKHKISTPSGEMRMEYSGEKLAYS